MPAYTPGPWSVAPHPDDADLIEVVKNYEEVGNGKRGHWIADCYAENDEPPAIQENIANAYLIAKAPELYEALKNLVIAVETRSWNCETALVEATRVLDAAVTP